MSVGFSLSFSISASFFLFVSLPLSSFCLLHLASVCTSLSASHSLSGPLSLLDSQRLVLWLFSAWLAALARCQ
jgi:hypothetical protein